MKLHCNNLSYGFGDKPLFKNLSFSARPGEHIIVEGDSGSGKSTFLKLLLGFYRPDEGDFSISGDEYNPQNIRKYTAWLPQDLNMGDGTVLEVIQKPFEFKVNQAVTITENKITDILERLNLSPGILNKSFRDLSTGQRQRIGIAICYLLDKPLMLLDEPTSALDQASKENAANLLLDHTNKIIISASHDPWWVKYADQLIKLY